MPARASYGTARMSAGTPTSERPSGSPPELGAAPHPTALHPQAGEPGEASAGDTNGARPGGPDGVARGVGADLRARLRPAQLRLSPRTGLQGRAAAGR